MAVRTYDADALYETMKPFLPLEGFHPDFWIEDTRNIALTDNKGSFALFEFVEEGLYCGHYFFQVKGKEACCFAKECLKEAFENQGVKAIIGLTPEDNKKALWMNRYLGFKYLDTVDSREGITQRFILTKKEWEQSNG